MEKYEGGKHIQNLLLIKKKNFQNLLDMRWVMDQMSVFGIIYDVGINH
jgi:hypothetical protein